MSDIHTDLTLNGTAGKAETLTVSTTELAETLAEVLGRVAYGGSRFTVTRHGKPLAVIVSVADAEHLTRVA